MSREKLQTHLRAIHIKPYHTRGFFEQFLDFAAFLFWRLAQIPYFAAF